MPNDGVVDQTQAELDRRRGELQAIMADAAQSDRHLDALRALNALNQIEAKLADLRILDRTRAFQAVSEALDEATAEITGNHFLSVFDDIRGAIGLGGSDPSEEA